MAVVMAAAGYPGAPRRGDPILGLETAATVPNVQILHAGTRLEEGVVVTSGGRVLTITATGIDLDADPTDPENGMGIIPRAVATIFSRARELREERAGAWNFSLKGSFIEIYNEDLLDLLADEYAVGGRRDVQIREDKHGHIIWDGLREVNVKNTSEVMK